jgi:hypothetical protein
VNGSLGVGTTSPGQKLSVSGTIESTSGGFKFPDATTQTSALGAAKAWVAFNGSTATILSSYNVSSVVRTSAGCYVVTFTNAMPDANYATLLTSKDNGSGAGSLGIIEWVQPGSMFFTTVNPAYLTSNDSTYVSVAVFR